MRLAIWFGFSDFFLSSLLLALDARGDLCRMRPTLMKF